MEEFPILEISNALLKICCPLSNDQLQQPQEGGVGGWGAGMVQEEHGKFSPEKTPFFPSSTTRHVAILAGNTENVT